MSPTDLRSIRTFPSLVKYLRDELDWPIETDDFDDLTFDYQPEELGIDPKTAARIEEIKQLRPLVSNQPWGIFFIKFEPKRLPVVVLRRILRTLVIKKRASASKSHQATWNLHDLLFISSYGESDHRDITFAHFTESAEMGDLPALRVLGWDDEDTVLHLEHAHKVLGEKLRWPSDPHQVDKWGEQWSSAFTLRHREVITTSKDLAIQLAHLATAIRKRVSKVLSIETESGPLHRLMESFKKALIHDLYEEAFADMYAQTITYGLLSARVSRPAGLVAENITDMVPTTNPFLKELLSTFLTVGGRMGKVDFDELGINEVVHALRDANMEAILRDFGDRNPQEDPVIHFYELFLKEYNPKLRMQRGVFYTPRPVVSFIVRSVDEILRTEFGLQDGLADITTWGEMLKRFPEIKFPKDTDPGEPFVQILDPALGTGTFLVEVINIIHKTMTTKWQKVGCSTSKQQQLWNEYVPKHLLPRVYGFELLMAPYTIAHMKIGLKLWETGYRFGSDERAHIYLTNSLEPPSDIQKDLPDLLPALANEAQGVNEVKRHKRFTIVIGNPPYAYQSVNTGEWITQLISDYLIADGKSLQERNPRGLQDDYVKFIRFAQQTVLESGNGAIGFITNHGFISNPTFRGMRESLSRSFNQVYVYDLHGNAKRGERTPSGEKDENVFDIMQGVSILTGLKTPVLGEVSKIYQADIFGSRNEKYKSLLLGTVIGTRWNILQPSSPFYLFCLRGSDVESEYNSYWGMTEIFPLSSVGISTSRDNLCVQFSPGDVYTTVKDFVSLPKEVAREKYNLGPDVIEWRVENAQNDLNQTGIKRMNVRPFLYRPFDVRYTYFTGKSRGFHSRPRYGVMHHMFGGENLAICTNRQVNKDFQHVFVSKEIIDGNSVSLATRERTYMFPLYVITDNQASGEGLFKHAKKPNLSQSYLAKLVAAVPLSFDRMAKYELPTGLTPEDIFHYIYAVLHCPGYRRRYAELLKIDFPRLPLTSNLELFHTLAKLGDELVTLHLMESPKLDKHITKFIGKGDNEVVKIRYEDQTVWINDEQGFNGVPEDVWNFHIGGYQVCEKWLKDRKGRRLTEDDITHYHKIVVAINETIRLRAEIDEVIEKHGGWPGAFTTQKPDIE